MFLSCCRYCQQGTLAKITEVRTSVSVSFATHSVPCFLRICASLEFKLKHTSAITHLSNISVYHGHDIPDRSALKAWTLWAPGRYCRPLEQTCRSLITQRTVSRLLREFVQRAASEAKLRRVLHVVCGSVSVTAAVFGLRVGVNVAVHDDPETFISVTTMYSSMVTVIYTRDIWSIRCTSLRDSKDTLKLVRGMCLTSFSDWF